jgi:hypothetical protein
MKKLIRVIYLCLLGYLGNTATYGCDCNEERLKQFYNLPNLIGKMDVVVFSGKVTRQTKNGPLGRFLVTFQIYDSWKNAESNELIVLARPNSNACGYDFTTGKTYFVVAYRFGDKYETSLCTPTGELFRSKKLMQDLDKVVVRKRMNTTKQR